MDLETFKALLERPESDTLDFKAKMHDFSEDSGRASLIKDVLCMANTPRDVDAHIVLGVKKHADGKYELWGLDKHVDEATIQSQFSERVHPIPTFTYEVLSYEKKDFGVITIPARRLGPCVPLKDFGGVLRQKQVYFRRGSKNDLAMPEDINSISAWVSGASTEGGAGERYDSVAWERFLQAVDNFNRGRRYVLISAPLTIGGIDHLASIGKISWTGAIDFDPNSDTTGLLSAIKPVLETHRFLHHMVPGDRPTVNPDSATYWYYARGLTGRDETLKLGPWREWVGQYKAKLTQHLQTLASAISPVPVTFIVLWYGGELNRHLQTALEEALAAFDGALDVVVATNDPAALAAMTAEIGGTLVDIPLHQLCSGLEVFLSSPGDRVEDDVDLPTSSGAPVRVGVKDRLWLEEELEIVHQNIGLTPPEGSDAGRDFLRGAKISWYELNLHADVDRDKTNRLEKIVRGQLAKKRTVRVNLYHAPGGGGTTVARRTLWKFHNEYPAAVLLRATPALTADKLYYLTSITSSPVLLLIDSEQVAERQVDELFDRLRSRQIPVVMLQTLRRFREQQEGELVRYLPAELSRGETRRFYDVFSRIEPLRRGKLESLLSSADGWVRTPFYFGLETFGENFLGLDSYVGNRLKALQPEQNRLLGFLAMAYHFAQRPLPAQAFAELLGVPRNYRVRLEEALPEQALDLLIEESLGVWRVAHELLAFEILKQLLTPPSGDRRLWTQALSTWSVNFADFCRGEGEVISDEMVEVARRAFIYRDNVDVLGTEKSAARNFSHLIESIPSREGRLQVLRHLVELFPGEAHFWSHLGRYYSIEMEDYRSAFECTERAIALQEDDHVLHHMQGMVIRYQIQDLIAKRGELSEMIALAKSGSAAFGRARELNPDEEHPYISEVQMLIRLLDYAGQGREDGVIKYLSLPSTDPYLREALERAEDLLEHVRRNREGEGPSSYEGDARAKLNTLYGRYEHALQAWDNLLSRPDTYRPPLRRQIVWTYLARQGRSWDRLATKEVERIISLMAENIEEDPSNERDLRLWVQAVRRSPRPVPPESVIERLSYWKAHSGALDSIFYLYVFNALLALEGSSLARSEALRYLEECKQAARIRRNRTKSFEWVGQRGGIAKLVHQSELGEWDQATDFWQHPEPLERVKGRIARVDSPQAGRIEVQGGLPAFFVPSRGGYSEGRSENKSVTFYLGFSYDGPRAWDVQDA